MILEFVAKKVATWAAKKLVSTGVDAYKEFKKTAEEKAADRIDPCLPCTQSKDERRRGRLNAIDAAKERVKDPTLPPESKQELQRSIERFDRNNKAVEYAKLSEHTYDQYDRNLKGRKPSGPPEGWEVVDPAVVGLAQEDVTPPPPSTFRAVVYRNTFGMTPEYTIAFRGTEPKDGQNDVSVDVQNAAGNMTSSYNRAKSIASKLQQASGMTGRFAITGHSLGGGLAQAMGAQFADPPPGYMFNSAGAHPDVVGKNPVPGDYIQIRSPCDPLTAVSGMQKPDALSTALQAVARAMQAGPETMLYEQGREGGRALAREAGLMSDADAAPEPAGADEGEATGKVSLWETARQVFGTEQAFSRNKDRFGWYVPPNAGTMHTASSYDNDGKEVPCLDPGGQHSITNLVNGIEHEKTVDLLVMQKHGAATVQARGREE